MQPNVELLEQIKNINGVQVSEHELEKVGMIYRLLPVRNFNYLWVSFPINDGSNQDSQR